MPELRARFSISELSLFGSVARDEARHDSDVDIMVSFSSTPSFYELHGAQRIPTKSSWARVDVVTRSGLKPRVRPNVEREALRVA